MASYQASLKDTGETLRVIGRTEYAQVVADDSETIKDELNFIDNWLQKWAPNEVRFALVDHIDQTQFNSVEQRFLSMLADKIASAPSDADGAWFHNTIYELKSVVDMSPQAMFTTLYKALIGKNSGPRAGWFLSILPRDWLIKRLRFAE